MKRLLLLIVITMCCLISSRCHAQLSEISLDEKTANASLIIEGKVVSRGSFWNPGHNMIFTANRIAVYKVFKGQVAQGFVDVLTQGGSVGNDAIEASDVLTLDGNDAGIFFCMPNTVSLRSPATGALLYDVYSSSQGFLKYNLSADEANAPFVRYQGIISHLYPLLQQKTGRPVTVMDAGFKAAPPVRPAATNRANGTAVISSFSPAAVWAGALNRPADNVLTINGSNFGTATAGKQLFFKDGNSSATNVYYVLDYNSPYITSWTDGQIVVKVPQRAATGSFGVIMAVGDTTFAASQLFVTTSILNASFFTNTVVSEGRLMNKNGTGGYTVVYSTNTAGSGTDITADSAYDCFRRALKSWQDLSGVNFTEGGTTTNQVINGGDGINTIMYDNANTGTTPVPAGTLAITYSSYSICGSSGFTGQKNGFDLVINKPGFSGSIAVAGNPAPYNKSYCLPIINTYDMEAILLHELGHALNLGHVYGLQEQTSGYTNRNPGAVMHPSVTLSIARKSPDYSSYAGSLYTCAAQGNNYGTCLATAEMTQTTVLTSPLDECPGVFPTTTTASGTQLSINLALATSNRNTDPQFTAIGTANTTSGTGVPVTNNVFFPFRTDAAGNINLIISGYATLPAEAAANCPGQGAKVALYRVSSCPAGQAFPAPVYVNTFAANATLPINNLLAATNYLLYFDGLSNTKASFTATLNNNGGSVLPITLKDFRGVRTGSINQLFIDINSSQGIKKLDVEKSADGNGYALLQTIYTPASTGEVSYQVQDASPFRGNNYYRLKIVSTDGAVEYSKTVLLARVDHQSAVAYPNPLKNKLTIVFPAGISGTAAVTILDAAGRTIYTAKTAGATVEVPFASRAAGIYFLNVTSVATGKTLLADRLIKQ